ncbi:MAG: cell division protein ZapA [Candidatus Cloacimonetes bacterium]|nr:cell division protein ZapA [Candidatus Cloacimonadota bacterium]MBL7087040.1 cell division protein ZapA [Candidatus Cloacimonadota bacterium]
MNNISVDIFGDKYSISGDVQPSEIKKYAEYLDSKLVELSTDTSFESRYKLAILCGLNIIEEMFNKKKQLTEIDKFITRLSKILDSIEEE